MITAAAPPSSGASVAPAASTDFFFTDAHYQSLAGRIIAAVHDGARFILVTGDPPVSPRLLSQALGKVARQRHSVIDIRCGPELSGDELARIARAVVEARASDGEREELHLGLPASPLLVCDDLDRLTDEQIQELHETMLLEECVSLAGVLLAHRSFLARLQGPALRFFEEGLGVHLRLDDVGPDESIAYLRHQLARRQQHSWAGRSPRRIFRALLALAFVITASIGAFVLVHPIVERVGGPTSAATDTSSTAKTSALHPMIDQVTRAVSAQAAPTSELPAIAATAPPAFAPAPPEDAQKATPPVLAPGSAPPATGSRLSAAEIAALVARGDKFLGIGDIASARLFYERAADAGDALAAIRLGTTFDPAFLRQAGIRAVLGDPAQALSWYRRAGNLGGRDTEHSVKRDTQRVAAPEAQTK
jgi:hypothetical protein